MNRMIEKLACKTGEGLQASSLSKSEKQANVFHRSVVSHRSSDLSFINGLISTGLRGTALLSGEEIVGNYSRLLTASRQHLALVVHTHSRPATASRYSAVHPYGYLQAVQEAGCFQLVAASLQEEIYLGLIAHRIAELSLIPGLVIADYQPSGNPGALPDDEMIRTYLGNPDDQIECPTPAQEMLFGRTRRRIPNWYSFDTPVMLGSKKDAAALSHEGAAAQKYFYDHLPELIGRAFHEFKEVFGIDLESVSTKGRSADFALVATGGQLGDLFDQMPELSKKTEIALVRQRYPFPENAIARLLKGKRSVTILENISGAGSGHSSFYHQVLNAAEGSRLKVYSGKYSPTIDAPALKTAIRHMTSNQARTDYYLGVTFTKEGGNYPKHEILMQDIAKKYPGINDASLQTDRPRQAGTSRLQDEIPLAVRRHRDQGPNYSQLARFYQDTAFFYEQGEHSELVADPFAALPVAPAASADFFSHSRDRSYIPVFDPGKCTACGDCFVHCPHSALPPLAIGVEQLMKAGAAMAAEKVGPITRLVPMFKPLAKVAADLFGDIEVSCTADFLPAAFERVAAQMKLEGEKLETARNEFAAVMEETGKLPVAVTDLFFHMPDSAERGSGELFSLAVDPVACTGCSVCAQVCAEGALTMEPQSADHLRQARDHFRLWEQLPDTPGDTINRLYHDPDYPSVAAILLSRNYYLTMTGGNGSEKYGSYKTLLHIITATAESVIQPRILAQVSQIDKWIDALSAHIHQALNTFLPEENLEGLSRSLQSAGGKKIPVREVISQISGDRQGNLIDPQDLGRRARLAEDLKNLKWVLSEGPAGTGRSRYGLLVAGSDPLEWAKQYPANPFTSPCVVHWEGSAPEQSLGLFYGQLRYRLDHIKLMRRAELESKNKYDPSVHDPEIAALSWDDLTGPEKQLVPPILLVAEIEDLNETGWHSLHRLMAKKYPVKVFLFDAGAAPALSAAAAISQANANLLSTLALKNAYVFQGGTGNIDHLFKGLMTGLDSPYPALFQLYATNWGKHGVAGADSRPYASLALNSRAFPCLRYHPEGRGDFLRGAIELDGNPGLDQDWVEEIIEIPGEAPIRYQISWADWAYTLSDWKDHFAPAREEDAKVPVPEYIQLDASARKGKVPVIMRADPQGLKHYAVSDLVVAMTESIRSNWNILRELAGLLTEFPVKLENEVTNTLSKKFGQEAAALKENYERQLKDQEAAQTVIFRQRLKEKLVALSKMARPKV